MKVNEVLTEGPIDAMRDAWAERGRNKQAKALANQRKKQIPKLAKQAQQAFAKLADKIIVQAKAANREVDADEAGELFTQALERMLQVDIEPGTPLGNVAEDILDQLMMSPETVRTNSQLRELLATAMQQAVEQPSDPEVDRKLASSKGTLIQDGEEYYIRYQGNTKWAQYAKDGDEYSYVGDITTKIKHDELNQLAKSGRTPIIATATPAADDRNITIKRLPEL